MMAGLVQNYTVDASDFSSAGEASGNVKKTLKKLGFAPDLIRRVSIAMYEAEINMVIHANGGTITVTISTEEISAVFADVGPGIPDVDQAMQEGWSTATEEVRGLGFGAGMGLPNIKKYADVLDIDTTVGVGTTVSMKFFVKQGGARL
ncbi:MAG: ATP-binding protein [Firmicutes bacterium]|nr:ATP-binding protein [Bacillota bacterium]MDD7603078.1 ATP-binding protein [Bacillota bacterium]